MKYCWSLDKINSNIKSLNNLIKYTDGLTVEEICNKKAEIDILKEMRNLLSNKMFINFSFFKQHYIDKNHLIPEDTFNDYNKIPQSLKKHIITSYNCFDKFVDNHDSIELPKLDITDEDLVDLAHDFFKTLPPFYQQKFDSYINPMRHLIHFSKDNNYEARGYTTSIFFPIYNPYIYISRSFNLLDLLTLNHELSHAIVNENLKYQPIDNFHYIMELEGYFFEFLTIEYLKKHYDNKIIEELEYDIFSTVYELYNSFYLTSLTISKFDKNNKNLDSVDKILETFLKKHSDLYVDKRILKDTLNENIIETSKYIISYLVFLDIKNIYFNDQELAFSLFENIRNSYNDNLHEIFEKNKITFMEDGYDNLSKEIKKMIKK